MRHGITIVLASRHALAAADFEADELRDGRGATPILRDWRDKRGHRGCLAHFASQPLRSSALWRWPGLAFAARRQGLAHMTKKRREIALAALRHGHQPQPPPASRPHQVLSGRFACRLSTQAASSRRAELPFPCLMLDGEARKLV